MAICLLFQQNMVVAIEWNPYSGVSMKQIHDLSVFFLFQTWEAHLLELDMGLLQLFYTFIGGFLQTSRMGRPHFILYLHVPSNGCDVVGAAGVLHAWEYRICSP